MPTDDLMAKLDAMVREQSKEVDGHADDCRLRECGDICSCGRAEYNIALGLLRQLEERDERFEKLRAAASDMSGFIIGWWPGLEDGINWSNDGEVDGAHYAYQAALSARAALKEARDDK